MKGSRDDDITQFDQLCILPGNRVILTLVGRFSRQLLTRHLILQVGRITITDMETLTNVVQMLVLTLTCFSVVLHSQLVVVGVASFSEVIWSCRNRLEAAGQEQRRTLVPTDGLLSFFTAVLLIPGSKAKPTSLTFLHRAS